MSQSKNILNFQFHVKIRLTRKKQYRFQSSNLNILYLHIFYNKTNFTPIRDISFHSCKKTLSLVLSTTFCVSLLFLKVWLIKQNIFGLMNYKFYETK